MRTTFIIILCLRHVQKIFVLSSPLYFFTIKGLAVTIYLINQILACLNIINQNLYHFKNSVNL
jgi:hypothetical protein